MAGRESLVGRRFSEPPRAGSERTRPTARVFSRAAAREWTIAIAIACGLTVFLLIQTPITTLWDRDEPRFAQAAVEMLRNGGYLVATFNEQPRLQKPVLIYWLMTLSLRVFGVNEFAVRFWSPIGIGIAALATFALGRRFWSARVGWLAMTMVVLNPLAIIEGQAATTDAVLLACTTVSLVLIAGALHASPRWSTAAALGVVLAAALLTKGPVGLVLPMAIAAVACWRVRHELPWIGRPIAVFVIASLIAIGLFGAWVVAATAASASVLAETLVRENAVRALVPMEGHGALRAMSAVYYPAVIVIGFSPWTLYLPEAIARWWKTRRSALPDAIVTAWIAVPLVVFTIAATKLPHYILPIWPPLALVAARAADTASRQPIDLGGARRAGVVCIAVLVAIEAAALVVVGFSGAIDGLAPRALLFAVLLASGFVPALRACARRNDRAAIACMTAAVAVNAIWAAFVVAPLFDRAKVVPALAETMPVSDAPLFAYEFAEPSLVFYGARPMSELVGDRTVAEWARQPGQALLVAPRTSIARVERAHGDLELRPIASRAGWNYANGQRLEVVLYLRDASATTALSPSPLSRQESVGANDSGRTAVRMK
jgi:4-amino-4-deoxy-L-arabinose transferase-like glycosyltransferase